MYIYGTYIPPFGGASLSLILSPSHQAHNIITKPPVALPYNLSHISPIFPIFAIPPSTASTTPSTILQSLLLPPSNIALQGLIRKRLPSSPSGLLIKISQSSLHPLLLAVALTILMWGG